MFFKATLKCCCELEDKRIRSVSTMEVSFSLNGGATQANLMTMALKRGRVDEFHLDEIRCTLFSKLENVSH